MKIVFNPDLGPQGRSGGIPIGLIRYTMTSSGTPVMPGSGVNQYLPPNPVASGYYPFEIDVPDGYGYQVYVGQSPTVSALSRSTAVVTSEIFTDDTEITFALFTGDLSTD